MFDFDAANFVPEDDQSVRSDIEECKSFLVSPQQQAGKPSLLKKERKQIVIGILSRVS